MSDLDVIDRFLAVFSRYIDSGFGLVRGEVGSLAQALVAIDVTLAALLWAWGPGEDVIVRLVRKVIYVGFFAFLLGDFAHLAQLVLDSFARLGLTAGGAGMGPADLLRPGRIAGAGVAAVRPLLAAAGELSGFPGLFENAVQIAVLLASAGVVLLAFFVIAVQLFVTLLEFKLTTLAGFILTPFGLFGRTAFLAERVLGSVMGAGVKVLVLAVVVGVGSTLFADFVQDFGGEQPTLEAVLAIALGALALLGLAIFAPGLAAGLASGAPQLGAGSAMGTGLALGGLAMAGAAAARSLAGGGLAAVRGARTLAARRGDGPPPAPEGGASGPDHGPPPAGPAPSGADGGRSAASPASAEAPAWAARLRRRGGLARGAAQAAHAVRSGDARGGSLSIPLDEETP